MNETMLRTTQPAAQMDDDEILDGWLSSLTPDDLDRFLNGLGDGEYGSTLAYDLPA
jgi:hypothetical protein